MARGQAGQADDQRGLTNNLGYGLSASATSELPQLQTQATSLMNSQGYDPTTLSAITNAGMGGVNAAFGDAGSQIKRNAAVTGNTAGVTEGLDNLAMKKGIAGGQEAGNIQLANADFKNQQRTQGIDLLNSLYGTNLNAANSLYNQGTGDLSTRAAGGGWAQGLQSVLTGVGSLLPKPAPP